MTESLKDSNTAGFPIALTGLAIFLTRQSSFIKEMRQLWEDEPALGEPAAWINSQELSSL